MSEYIQALTFPDQIIRPEDDGMIRSQYSTNGIIAGVIPGDPIKSVGSSYRIKLITGWLMLAGRQLKVNAPDGLYFTIDTNKNYVFLIVNMDKSINSPNSRAWIDIMYSDSGECPTLNKGYINTGAANYTQNNLYQDVLLGLKRTGGSWSIFYRLKHEGSSALYSSLAISPSEWVWDTDDNEYKAIKSVSWVHPDDVILVTYGRKYRSDFLNNGVYCADNGFGTIDMRASSIPSRTIYALVVCIGTNIWGHSLDINN